VDLQCADRCAVSSGEIDAAYVCTRGQRLPAPASTLLKMRLNSIKAPVTGFWVLAVFAAAIVLNVGSLSGWTVITLCTIFPPLVMMWRWNDSPATISEIIQEARR